MTSLEMLREFKVGMDKIDSDSYPEIYPEQIFMFINKAIDNLVREGRAVFEKDQMIIDNLKSLIPKRPAKLIATKVKDTEEYEFDLRNIDYLFYIRANIRIKVGDRTGISAVKVEQHDDIEIILDDPHNKPKAHKVPITFARNTITAYGDTGFTIQELNLTYVKKPAKVSKTVDCDIDEQLHYAIVDAAIAIAMESLGLTNKQ